MKVKITALKAPWPEGAQVGEVVEFNGDTLPAWAAGKCIRVDGEKADHVYEPPAPVENGGGPVLASLGTVNLEVAELKDSLQLARAAVQSLEAEKADLVAENHSQREQLAAAASRIADFEAEKAKGSDVDAQADAEKARLALEEEARSLKLSFHPNTGDEKLRKLIAEAKAK